MFQNPRKTNRESPRPNGSCHCGSNGLQHSREVLQDRSRWTLDGLVATGKDVEIHGQMERFLWDKTPTFRMADLIFSPSEQIGQQKKRLLVSMKLEKFLRPRPSLNSRGTNRPDGRLQHLRLQTVTKIGALL